MRGGGAGISNQSNTPNTGSKNYESVAKEEQDGFLKTEGNSLNFKINITLHT